MNNVLQLEVESRIFEVSRPAFLVNAQHQRLGIQTYMDECEQQILHEFRHATANPPVTMASDSSTIASSETVKSPPLATEFTSSQQLQQPHIPSNPMEALQRLVSSSFDPSSIITTLRAKIDMIAGCKISVEQRADLQQFSPLRQIFRSYYRTWNSSLESPQSRRLFSIHRPRSQDRRSELDPTFPKRTRIYPTTTRARSPPRRVRSRSCLQHDGIPLLNQL